MRFTNPLGPTVLAPTSIVDVQGASSLNQASPTFLARTASAGSTASLQGAGYLTLIPAPGVGKYLELHGVALSSITTPTYFSTTPNTTNRFAVLQVNVFNFEGATLGANLPVYVYLNPTRKVQLNYSIR